MKPKIVVVPSEDEITQSLKKRLAEMLPTYLESWPDALMSLSFPQVRVQLSKIDVAVLKETFLFREGEGEEPSEDHAQSIRDALDDLRSRLDVAVKTFPEGAFVRLGSRSPKDSWEGMRNGFRCIDGTRALDLLMDSTERIWDDISLSDRGGHEPSVYLRAWRNFPAWAEFRCFVQDGVLIGASQYDYNEAHPEIAADAAGIEKAIRSFVVGNVVPALHVDPVVVDVAFVGGDLAKPVLVEINPFSSMTDPALFVRRNPMAGAELDGFEFRFHGDGRDHGIYPRKSKKERNAFAASLLIDSPKEN